jgi:glutamyl-tRNA synthetase
MASKTRVRFAPSPTGPLHIGGVRTALYNYLFAKKNDGDFLLRIEDTDRKRYVEGAENYVIESLNWLNIPFDEGPGKEAGHGPYRQSERRDIYDTHIQKLLDEDKAYYAFDTPEELADARKNEELTGSKFIYNWRNREDLINSFSLSKEEVEKRIDRGDKYVIRFKAPHNINLRIEDEIRGKIDIDTTLIDDKILFKSDGWPTYHLANIVDDHLMEITHVIRGEEWLPSLALHVLLYQAFGWEVPKFAHLPLILKPSGKGKLSKRDGEKMGFPVFPLEWKKPDSDEVIPGYREDGYLPEAVINMLAFLGWNEGEGSEKEIYSLEELTKSFSLEQVTKSGSNFNPEKTKWFQHQYLQTADNVDLVKKYMKVLNEKGFSPSTSYVEDVVKTIKERADFVSDFWELSYFYFEAPQSFDEKSSKKAWKEATPGIMGNIKKRLGELDDFSDQEKTADHLKSWIKEQEFGFGKAMQPLRLALVGKMMGPDLFHIMKKIGKEETLKRIDFAISELS